MRAGIAALAAAIAAVPGVSIAEAQRWTANNMVNEYGEKTGTVAVSGFAEPIRPSVSSFGLQALVMVDCGVVVVRLNRKPQLREGFFLPSPQIQGRIDGKEIKWTLFQSDNDLHFLWSDGAESRRNGETSQAGLIRALSEGTSLALSIPLEGGNVAFRWSLSGSSAAIDRSCRP